MNIVSTRTWFEDVALTRPYTIAFRTVSAVRLGFVEIRGADGTAGLGAAAPESYVTGETEADCEAALATEAVAWLQGRDVRHLEALCREAGLRMPGAPAARAAVDMALHDLLARHLGLPLVDLLGRAHTRLPTSITIGIMPVADALARAEEHVGRGFRVLKVKLGHDLEEDLERLHRLRERVGPSVGLRVDSNQGYGSGDVDTFVRRTERLGIEFLEQPMPAAEVAAMRALPAPVRARLAADESLLDEADALALLAPPRACGIFNIKLMKCGGVRSARRIATMAETAGIELMWGCMDESAASIAAALHAALASPATRYLDLDGSLELARDPVAGGFVLEDGLMSVTDAPGTGTRLVDDPA